MHHQLLQWVDPAFKPGDIFEHWAQIVHNLAEAPRKRQPQVERVYENPQTS